MSNNNPVVSTSAAVMAADIDNYVRKVNKLTILEFDKTVVSNFKLNKIDPTNFSYLIYPEGLRKFVTKVGKEVKKNVILDTDKVFFEKGSSYPRNNFNKYSPGAKRIQSFSKADKIVIGDLSSITFRTNYNNGVYYEHTNGRIYYLDTYTLVNTLHNMIRHGSTSDQAIARTVCKKIPNTKSGGDIYSDLSSTGYYVNTWDVVKNFREGFISLFPDPVNMTELNEWNTYHDSYNNVPEREMFYSLLRKTPLTDYVTDKTVNNYIDDGKPTLTASQMENIMPLLKGDEANVGIALKLLENMNLTDTRAEFYSMMLLCFINNERRIKNTPAWNYTAIKNLRKQYDLNQLNGIQEFRTMEKIRRIGELVNSVPQDKREDFRGFVSNTIIELVKKETGVNLIDIIK